MKLHFNLLISILLVLAFNSCVNNTSQKKKIIPYNAKEIKEKKLQSGKWGKFRANMTLENEPYATYDYVHPESLTFDMYKPTTKEEELLPLVVFVHSGAFIMGDKKNYIISQYCKDIVRTGKYAAASINYRIINHTKEEDSENLKVLISKGYTRHKIIEALGDVKTSIKYFIDNSARLNIDPNKIYVVGYSAGAILANHLIFTNKNEIDKYINEHLVDNILNLGLKKLDMDPLYSIDNMDAFDYDLTGHVKGIVSISGGLMDYRMLDDMDNAGIPMLLIHGTKDGIVPNGKGSPFSDFSKNDYKKSVGDFYFNIGVKTKNDGEPYEDIVDSNGKSYQFNIEFGKVVKKEKIKQFISLFTTPVCGSECIYDGVFKDSNLQYIEIKNAPHVFMLNDNGLFNKTYLKTRQEIYKFITSNH